MAEGTESTEAGTVVERTEQFGVTPDALWDAITDPELLEEWFGPVDIELTPGGAITDAGAALGVVETVEAPNRIGFVWIAPGTDAPSSVELVIEADDVGSILRVREARIEPRWDVRPAWLASTPRACAGARV
jgi:uncharacterized protein YndB with AHSA1/START domain